VKADVGASVGKVRSVLTVVAEDGARREDVSLLDDVVREGARRMLTAALEAEVDAYLAELAGERDGETGRRGDWFSIALAARDAGGRSVSPRATGERGADRGAPPRHRSSSPEVRSRSRT
jgi:hypothetical protein